MFVDIIRTETICLHPRFLNGNVTFNIQEQLKKEYNNTMSENFGFTLDISDVSVATKALITNANGYLEFPVRFNSKCIKIEKDEIITARVTDVMQTGFFAQYGPYSIYVGQAQIPNDLYFNNVTKTFTTQDKSYSLEKNFDVKIKIIGIKYTNSKFIVIGSIKGDYLG